MLAVPKSTIYTDKFKGFNRRTWEYINNTKNYTYNVLEGAVRSSKTVANIYAMAMAIEESPDRLHAAMGFSAKAAVRNIFESDGLGLMYFPFWQGRLFTESTGPGTYALVLLPKEGSGMPIKKILPLAGGDADSESSFRGASFGIVGITEANLLHPNSITAINERTYAATIRRFFIDFNPSSEANFLYRFIGRKWLGMRTLPLRTGTPLPLGYTKTLASGKQYKVLQYMHCTFSDNLSLTPDRIEEILAANDPDSPEYKRNVLGLRASGAGKIYMLRPKNFVEGQIFRAKYFRYIIVADPGTSASETAFLLAALTNDKVPELHILNEYAHTNNMENLASQKADIDYVYDLFNFIRECEDIMKMPPWKIIVDVAAVPFIREYSRNAKLNKIIYPLTPSVKRPINERIKSGKTLQYSGRLKYHKIGAQKTISEFEDAEYDEKKSLNGEYVRLDNPTKGKQMGLVDCTEYAIEAFTYALFRPIAGQRESEFQPTKLRTSKTINSIGKE